MSVSNSLYLILPFGLSLLLGALIGLEREFSWRSNPVPGEDENEDIFGGTRTFALIALFGSMAAFVDQYFFSGFLIVSFAGVILITTISYAISYFKHGEKGITTEITVLIVFVLGVLTQLRLLISKNPPELPAHEYYLLAASITVMVLTVLYMKSYLSKMTKKIEPNDIRATLKFAAISIIILPLFDPEVSIKVSDLGEWTNRWAGKYPKLLELDILVPHNVWLMVVLISGIGFLGYVAIKILGSRKGIGLSGFLGGLASSTATTLAFAKRSKDEPALSAGFSLAIILACSTMFLRILLEVLVIHPPLISKLSISMLTMTGAGLLVCLFLWYKSGKEKLDEQVPHKNPFEISPALKFGLLYAVIVLITRLVDAFELKTGMYIVSIISGATDVDAITLSMSTMVKDDPSPEKMQQAAVGITLAAFSNTFLKAGMAAVLGGKKLRKITLICFAIIVVMGGLSLLFIV